MLYKFKSKAAGDLIMLEPNGRRVLQIIGKDPQPQGIILPAPRVEWQEVAELRQESRGGFGATGR